jgi:D-alanine-D-alanine ligase-like ATP-grasp enzyme
VTQVGEPGDAASHYPFPTRTLLELHAAGELPRVREVEVEPEYGYAVRIVYGGGSVRMVYGNDLGLNSAAAAEVVHDKGHTKTFLIAHGIACPRGAAFLLPWWADEIAGRAPGPARTTSEAAAFAESELGLPVYVKQVRGSGGRGVCRCESADQVESAVRDLAERRARVALVEEAVDLPDFRIVVARGELVAAYERVPLTVVGDGEATIAQLLGRVQSEPRTGGLAGRRPPDDERVAARLARAGLDLQSIPSAGESVRLLDVSNLSAGGTGRDVTSSLARRWLELAVETAGIFGLDFCGVDLACADAESADGSYAVLEVNKSPGLEHYAAIGPEQLRAAREFYARVIGAPPALSA